MMITDSGLLFGPTCILFMSMWNTVWRCLHAQRSL